MIHSLRMGNDSKAMQKIPDWNTYLLKVGTSQDKAAFGALFEYFSPRLKTFLMQGSNLSAENAEELVQEAMTKVWRRAPSFAPTQASASTWIYTIARNTRIDWFRKNSRQDPLLFHAEDLYGDNEEASPYSTLAQLRSTVSIHEQLNELPQEQSEVLNIMYFKGLSGQQTAEALAIPLGTVKSRIRLALKKLRVGLAVTGGNSGQGTNND